MISIIICSRTAEINPELKANIDATIGTAYEIVIINNSANQYGICEAYNIGVEKSTYPYLCFMHDDIRYHTNNWGQKIAAHFKDGQTGAIGIAGSPYATLMPGSWWGGGLINQQLQVRDEGGLRPVTKSVSGNPVISEEVIVLDGVWLCVAKALFNKIKFDEVNFKGYHFYDVDISLQIHMSGFKLFSIFDIAIEHFSKGDINQDWITSASAFNKKWKPGLPTSCINLSYAQQCEAEFKTLQEFVSILLVNNTAPKQAYALALQQIAHFYKGYLYYKTPVYYGRYLIKYLQALKTNNNG